MALLEVLSTLAATLQVQRIGSPAPVSGDPVRVRLAPPTTGLSVTDLATAPVNLAFISKGVQFVNAQPEPDVLQAAIEGGTPRDRRDDATTTITGTIPTSMTGSITAPVGSVVTETQNTISTVLDILSRTITDAKPSTDALDTAQGLLGQITGSIPIPINLPVSVEVEWHVYDEGGAEIFPGAGFETSGALNIPEISIVLPVETAELTTEAPVPLPRIYSIEARVRLTCAPITGAPVTTDWIALPRLPVAIAVIPIPTILALIQLKNFKGFIVVAVPSTSPLSVLAGQAASTAQEQLTALLQGVRSTVENLTHLPGFLSFMVGLNQLLDVLPGNPHFRFVAGDGPPRDGIEKMHSINMGYKDDAGINIYSGDDVWVRADNRISSLILLGPEGRRVKFFNDAEYKTKHGAFQMTIGPELFATVRWLRETASDAQHVTPTSVPAGRCEVTVVPPGVDTGLVKIQPAFGNSLSSFYFTATPQYIPPDSGWPPGMGLALGTGSRTKERGRGTRGGRPGRKGTKPPRRRPRP